MKNKKKKMLPSLLAVFIALNVEATTTQNNDVNSKLEFEYSSIQNPRQFQNELVDRANHVLSKSYSQIRNNKFSEEKLQEILLQYFPQADDPQSSSSENLLRSHVYAGLYNHLMPYLKEPTLSWSAYQAKPIVEQAMNELLGKQNEPSKPKESITREQKEQYAQEYCDEENKGSDDPKIKPSEHTPDSSEHTAAPSVEPSDDMGKILAEKEKQLRQNTQVNLPEMVQETEKSINEASTDVNNIEKDGQAAVQKAQKDQEARVAARMKEAEEQAKKIEEEKKAKEAAEAEVAEDVARDKITNFLRTREDARKFIEELLGKKRNSAYIADALLDEYSDLAEVARVNENEPSSKIKQRVKAVLEAHIKEAEEQTKKIETGKKAKEAEKVTAAEDAAKDRISKFLRVHDGAEKFIEELLGKKRNSAYIAAALLDKYSELTEAARLNDKERSSKIRQRVKTVLEELYTK